MVTIMSEQLRTTVRLKLEKDMIFKCDMGNMKVKECYIDDTNEEEFDTWGPNPSKLLASAVLGCMSASLVFCVGKKGLKFDDFESEAEYVAERNDKGFWRVKEINVKLKPTTNDESVIKRLKHCEKFFEDYCVITQSVRQGITVNAQLDY